MQESCIHHGGCRHNCNLPLAMVVCQVLTFTILRILTDCRFQIVKASGCGDVRDAASGCCLPVHIMCMLK